MSAWPQVPIKECARVVGGSTPKSETAEYWGGDIPWTTPKDLSDLQGKFIWDTPRKITEAGLKSCSSELLPANSVLFSSRAPIGHVAINSVPMATNQGFKSFIPGPKLDSSFLFWWLKANRAKLEQLGNGATFKEVSKAIVERIEIPLPPLEEQKRIAAILDQADELRRKRKQALDRLNQLGQAIFYEMFGDDEGGVPISEYLDDIQSGKNLVGVADDDGSSFRVLKISAVSRYGFRADETKPLPSDYVPPRGHIVANGDLLFSRANTTELVGIPCVVEGVPENVALPDKLWRLVPSSRKSVSAFLCHALLSQASRRQIEKMCSGTSGSMQNISMQKFKNIRVPRASLQDQIRFQDAIALVSAAKRDLENHHNRADTLFCALQHSAFRGELTVSSLKEVAA